MVKDIAYSPDNESGEEYLAMVEAEEGFETVFNPAELSSEKTCFFKPSQR